MKSWASKCERDGSRAAGREEGQVARGRVPQVKGRVQAEEAVERGLGAGDDLDAAGSSSRDRRPGRPC
jgi:hypothetical protein